jgi:hypothetical protein
MHGELLSDQVSDLGDLDGAYCEVSCPLVDLLLLRLFFGRVRAG